MHYIESGVGTPLVLLHAFPVDGRMWNGARALLEEQARVITPDQRGLGESPLDGSTAGSLADAAETRRAAAHPSLELVAEDVLALLDMLGLEKVFLGGCSMGGYTAMAVLRAAPERVAGVVLADTKAFADEPAQRDNRLAVAERAEREGIDGWLAENSLPGVLGATTRAERPGAVARIRELVESQPAEGVAWAQRAMAARPDHTGTLRAYSGPALVISGEEDTLTPPDLAAGLASTLPAGTLRTLPGVGHLAPAEDPEAFARTVIGWLNTVA